MKNMTNTENAKFGILSALKGIPYNNDVYDKDETRLFQIPRSALIREIILVNEEVFSGHTNALDIEIRLLEEGEDFASVPIARKIGSYSIPNVLNKTASFKVGAATEAGKIFGSGNSNFILSIKPTFTEPAVGTFRLLVRYDNLSRRDSIRD